jgi:hypothetical protein
MIAVNTISKYSMCQRIASVLGSPHNSKFWITLLIIRNHFDRDYFIQMMLHWRTKWPLQTKRKTHLVCTKILVLLHRCLELPTCQTHTQKKKNRVPSTTSNSHVACSNFAAYQMALFKPQVQIYTSRLKLMGREAHPLLLHSRKYNFMCN